MKHFPYTHILQYWQSSIGKLVDWEVAHHKHTVFYITTDNGKRFVLKQVQRIPTVERLESEYRLLCYLQDHDIPVSVPLLTKDNRPFVITDNKIFTLSPNLYGAHSQSNLDNKTRYQRIGHALAHFHKVLATYPHPIQSWTMDLPQKLQNEILPLLNQQLDAEQKNALLHRIQAIQPTINTLWQQLPTQRIHGDCHGGNLLFDGVKVCGFIDLDHLPMGVRVYDIFYFLADEVKTRIHQSDELEQWITSFPKLIAGYEQITLLESQEKEAIWYGMLITQLLFVEWFLRHNDTEQTDKNLQVFDWIYAHQKAIANAILNR